MKTPPTLMPISVLIHQQRQMDSQGSFLSGTQDKIRRLHLDPQSSNSALEPS